MFLQSLTHSLWQTCRISLLLHHIGTQTRSFHNFANLLPLLHLQPMSGYAQKPWTVPFGFQVQKAGGETWMQIGSCWYIICVCIYIYTRTFIYIQYQYASTTKICVQTYWHTYVWEVELAQAFQCNVLSVGTQWFMEVSPAPMFTQDRRFSFMLMMWSFHTRRKYDISKMVRTWVNHWHPKAWQITTWKRTCSWRAGGYWSGVSMNILASVQWRCALQLCAGFPSGLWMIVGFGEFTWVHPGHAQLFSFSLEGQNPKGLSKRKG